MLKKASIILFSILFYTNTVAQLNWYPITQQTKPWARWWWLGSAVNQKDLSWNMQSYQAAGLGGLEITPIYGIKGYEKQFIPYLSPQWAEVLQHTLKEAKRLDLGIDLANTSGWPFGGPWINNTHESKRMFWKTFDLKGDEKLDESITFLQPPILRVIGTAPKLNELKYPIETNENLQLMAIDQVRFERNIPLHTLMAYDGNGNSINLTKQIDSNGKLNWTAPAESNWKIYALFQGEHGKMVERAGPGGEGLVIDHFSKPALNHYLEPFDKFFKTNDLSGIRAFFNDSYEVDDASGQSNFTPELFTEFQNRRGYDLRNHLPALLEKSDSQINNRILCDYRQTIHDLLLYNFTKPWQVWGKNKGKLIRNQAHGSPANMLDLYATVDIPETEGNHIPEFKLASSPAHLTGKPLVSCEAATWLNDHFLSNLSNVKEVVDKFFVGGVNHLFYHGVSYSPKDVPWPGWLFYASEHFNQTNPNWQHFSTLNNYIAHCQSFLQQGKSDNDVLLYFPIYDSYSERGTDLLKHYNGYRHDIGKMTFSKLADEMQNQGYAFDFISDKQIEALISKGTTMESGDSKYKTIILPDCQFIPLATWKKVFELARAGAMVIAYKKLPSNIPGFVDFEKQEKELQTMLNSLNFTSNNGIKVAKIGKGKFVLGDEIKPLLSEASVKNEPLIEKGLQFVRRKTATGYIYFITNLSNQVQEGWIPLSIKTNSITIFNPMLKVNGLAKLKNQSGTNTEVYLQLKSGESCILQSSNTVIKGKEYVYYKPIDTSSELTNWEIQFLEGGSTIPKSIKTEKPASWTEIGDDAAKSFSGIASYSTTFEKPKTTAKMWQLDFGKIHESAEVYLNGQKIATLLGPDYSVDFPNSLLKTTNKLEVKVANLMANRIIDMEKKGIPYKIFYNTNFPAFNKENRGTDGLFTTQNWSPKPSGIVGKVVLRELERIR